MLIEAELQKSLETLRPIRSLIAIIWNWLLIFSCFFILKLIPSPTTWLLCFILIASRQHALLVLLHDGVHSLLHPNRSWNNRMMKWLISYPFLFEPSSYKKSHLQHHAYMNTEKDPDWTWKIHTKQWQFPKRHFEFLGFCLRAMVVLSEPIQRFRGAGKAIISIPQMWKSSPSYTLLHLIYFGAILVFAWWAEIFHLILFAWFLPMFTLLQLIHRIRSVAEHFGVHNDGGMGGSRVYKCGLLERLLLAPHNVYFHLDHHLYPHVPFYHLPRLHYALRKNREYIGSARINQGLIFPNKESVLTDVLTS